MCGRRQERLESTQQAILGSPLCQSPHIRCVPADIGSDEGRQSIIDAINEYENAPVSHVVHNAAVLNPIGPLSSIRLDEFRSAMQINVEAPLFLTQILIPHFSFGARVLHISSGAAHRPIVGWGAYCISKAAFHQAYRVLNEELKSQGVLVGSVRPGVVDTEMQREIRSSTADSFPQVQNFINLKAKKDQLESLGQLKIGVCSVSAVKFFIAYFLFFFEYVVFILYLSFLFIA